MRLISLIVSFCFCFNAVLNAQSFTARVDAKKIIEGSYVEVEFILDNIEGDNFTPPKFENFSVLSGPNRSSSMQITNGRVKQKLTYSYALQPKSLGKISIGSATIRTNAGILKTSPLIIEVIKGNKSPIKKSGEVFIQTIISDSTAYVGQQVILEYKLYTNQDVRQINFMGEQSFDGFFKQNLPTNNERTQREIINGQEYSTKIVKRFALFPQQTGTYTIEPTSVSVGISQGGSRSIFFQSQLKQQRLIADGVTIVVDNTPESAPRSFSGAIGSYSMQASTDKRSITTDDAIVIRMEISGDGDSKTVGAPLWANTDSLEVYDPNLLDEQNIQNNKKNVHKKLFEYLLVPKYPGNYKLRPELTYFDPSVDSFKTITYKLPRINVLKGNQGKYVPIQENLALLAPLYTSTKLKPRKALAIKGIFFYGILILLLVVLISLLYYEFFLLEDAEKRAQIETKEKAAQRALVSLEDLKPLISSNQSKAYFESSSLIIKQYLEDKYDINALHINKVDIIEEMKSNSIPATFQSTIVDFLNKSEMALYAPVSVEGMEETHQKLTALFA